MGGTWICEFSKEVTQLMAALLYDYLAVNPDHKVALQALDELVVNTENTVDRDPKKHPLSSIPSMGGVPFYVPNGNLPAAEIHTPTMFHE
jgi:hypothetical protein